MIELLRLHGGERAGAAAAGLILLLTTACATSAPRPSAPPAAPAAALSDDTDAEGLPALMAQMRHDLQKLLNREKERLARLPKSHGVKKALERMTADTRITSDVVLRGLLIPVSGLTNRDLRDSWGEPRDGGKRSHKGIDIFAPKGREVLAVADGYISYIGTQPKGGRCLWLVNDSGISFYYAHLDKWAAGIYEGMEIKKGELLGYVGNTGNAITTPPHLHFGVIENDVAINPYPLLTGSVVFVRTNGASGSLEGGFGRSGAKR